MTSDLHDDPSGGSTLDVDTTPITLRLPAGAAIFAVHGEAWLTQEQRIEDVMLSAGARYDVPDRQPIVVSATRGRARLYLAGPAAARNHSERNLHDFARSRAAELRAHEAERLAHAAARSAQAWWQRLRTAFAVRPRVPMH